MKWLSTLQCLGEEMHMSFDVAGDEWEFICWAGVKTIAVNSGQVVLLLW